MGRRDKTIQRDTTIQHDVTIQRDMTCDLARVKLRQSAASVLVTAETRVCARLTRRQLMLPATARNNIDPHDIRNMARKFYAGSPRALMDSGALHACYIE